VARKMASDHIDVFVSSDLYRSMQTCAIIIGALLIQYREQTVTWITIAIGVLFFLSGVFSLLSYMSAKRNAEKMKFKVQISKFKVQSI
jgi:uncharacterized membrane protein HdeD (DUF308 family)